MESLYAVFAKDVEVIYREDHIPTFNGYETIHAALVECNEIYRSLNFSDQSSISSHVLNMLCPLDEEVPVLSEDGPESKTNEYIYTYEWFAGEEDHNCFIFDADSGDIIFSEWFKTLQEKDVMTHLEDVDGLIVFLLHHGELLEGDSISFQSHLGGEGDLET